MHITDDGDETRQKVEDDGDKTRKMMESYMGHLSPLPEGMPRAAYVAQAKAKAVQAKTPYDFAKVLAAQQKEEAKQAMIAAKATAKAKAKAQGTTRGRKRRAGELEG